MNGVIASLRRFLASEDGPTAAEYALMLVLIITICITAVGTLGTTLSGSFESSENTMFGS